MQIRARLAAPALALAAGLVLAGCGDHSGSSAAAAPAGGSSTSSGSSPSGGSTGTAGGAGTTGSTSGGTSGTTANGGATGGSSSEPARCRTADLAFGYGPDSGAQAVGEQGGVNVTLTNRGASSCSFYGYPGVDLVGTVDGKAFTWSLARGGQAKPSRTTVKPGGTAHFWITYLPDSGKGGNQVIKVKKIVITPPDETHPSTLAWDYQDVTLQDGATHPGTFVGAVEPGRTS